MGSTEKIEAQKTAIGLTERILGGAIDLASGVWELYPHLRTLKIESNEEYLIFNAFRSDTDYLPLPAHKENWEPTTYSEEVDELQKIEAVYREEINSACSILGKVLKDKQY